MIIKGKAIINFGMKDFDKLSNIVRISGKKQDKKIFKYDIFECDIDTARYLLGNNDKKIKVMDIIEIIP